MINKRFLAKIAKFDLGETFCRKTGENGGEKSCIFLEQ